MNETTQPKIVQPCENHDDTVSHFPGALMHPDCKRCNSILGCDRCEVSAS
jgi:hypothetical protein